MNKTAINIKTPRQLRIGSAVFFFVSGLSYSTWASRIPNIQHRMHLNDAQLGLVLFCLPIGLLITMPVTSILLSRFNSRSILLVASISIAIVLTLLGVASSTWQLAVLLFCFGSSRNMQTLSINTQAVAVQSLYGKSIMVLFHGIWSLAGFAGAGIGYLMVYFNVLPAFHFSFVAVILLLLTSLFLHDTMYQQPDKTASRKPVFSFPDKYLIKFSLICFACMACENTMYDWAALYFLKVVHAEQSTVTAAFVIYMVTMTAGRFFGDRLVTRSGVKNVLKFSGLFIFFGLALAVAFPNKVIAGTGFALVGLGVSCVVPMVFGLAGKSVKVSSSTALASISSIGYLGFLFIPPFVGIIAHASSLRLSFAIISMFGLMIVYLVSRLSNEDEKNATVSATTPDI